MTKGASHQIWVICSLPSFGGWHHFHIPLERRVLLLQRLPRFAVCRTLFEFTRRGERLREKRLQSFRQLIQGFRDTLGCLFRRLVAKRKKPCVELVQQASQFPALGGRELQVPLDGWLVDQVPCRISAPTRSAANPMFDGRIKDAKSRARMAR
jgi:hypothetical protein